MDFLAAGAVVEGEGGDKSAGAMAFSLGKKRPAKETSKKFAREVNSLANFDNN